jgi:isoleucyl-tRNA synthetase
VTVAADGDLKKFLEIFGDTLPDLLLVSDVKIGLIHDKYVGSFSRNPQVQIGVSKSEREKCERCWRRAPGVGGHKDHPTLCTRCVGVVG